MNLAHNADLRATLATSVVVASLRRYVPDTLYLFYVRLSTIICETFEIHRRVFTQRCEVQGGKSPRAPTNTPLGLPSQVISSESVWSLLLFCILLTSEAYKL